MLYSPQRDLANIFMPMLREVCVGLAEQNWGEEIRCYCGEHDISEEELGKAVEVIIEAVRLFIKDPDVHSPNDALTKAGVGLIREPVSRLMFSRIGQVVLGGFFVAIRDVTEHGKMPSAEFIDFVAAGRQLANMMSGHNNNTPDVPTDDDVTLQTVADEQKRVILQLQTQLDTFKTQRDNLDKHNRSLSLSLSNLEPLLRYLRDTKASGWWNRLCKSLWFAWTIFRKDKV